MSRANVTCGVTDVYSVLMSFVEENVTSNQDAMEENIRKAGDDCADYIKSQDYPYARGDRYASGWRSRFTVTADGHCVALVHNVTQPSLTHLIEKGHELFYFGVDTGKRTRAKPYIREGYEHATPIALGRVT